MMARYEDDVNEKTNSDGHDIVAGKSYTDQRFFPEFCLPISTWNIKNYKYM